MKITLSKGIALGTLLVAGLFLGCRHEVNKTQQGGAGAGGTGGNAQYNEPVRVLNGMIEADQRTVPDRLIDVGDKSTWLNIQGVSSNTYRIPSLIKVAGGEHKGKIFPVAFGLYVFFALLLAGRIGSQYIQRGRFLRCQSRK